METCIPVRTLLVVTSPSSLITPCCWSCDSDYRGLKKRIVAVRQDKGGGAGKYVNVSSESELDASPSRAGPSTRPSDEYAIVDKGHEANDETDVEDKKRKQHKVVDTRDDRIELKKLKRKGDSSDKVLLVDQHTFLSVHASNSPSR